MKKTHLIKRRTFLRQGAGAGLAVLAGAGCISARRRTASEPMVMTVTGMIPASELGVTLPHEHIVVDFAGAEQFRRRRYDEEEVVALALPQLQRLHDRGCRSLAECTPAYLGRDPLLLRRLSGASGIQILINTGYYGAAKSKYLPRHASTESADALSARWLYEWSDGIEGTGVRAGFIKTGVDSGKLPELHEKLIRAAARTHRKSGLAITVHTGDSEAALGELRILAEEGVHASALICAHAQNLNEETRREMARRGAWVSLDGVNAGKLAFYVSALVELKRRELLDRVLISQDDGWAVQGRPKGENLRLFDNGNEAPYDTIFTRLIPELKKNGFGDREIEQIMAVNPRTAFALEVREL